MLKIKDNVDLKLKLQELVDDLILTLEYAKDEDSSRYDKIYATCIERILKNMEELGLTEEINNVKDKRIYR